MAIIGNGALTLLDEAKRKDPNGKTAKIVEILNKNNQILDDMVVVEGNTTNGMKTTIRTGLPSVAWRQINKGIQPSKSTTKQIDFTAGMLEGMGQVDEELVNLSSDPGGLRISENAPFLESIAQTLASTMIYGDVTVNPERFTGLAPFYSSLSGSVASSANIIDAGGTGSTNTSLWLVCWSEQTAHGFYPKGTKAGIEHNDLGKMLVDDGTGTNSKFMAYVDQYKAKLGFSLRDYRYVVRVCNIDITTLATAGDASDTSTNLIKHAIKATNIIPNLSAGRCAWYCNKEVKTALDIKALSKSNLWVSMEDLAGGAPVTKLLGIPVRRVDAILNTESRVV